MKELRVYYENSNNGNLNHVNFEMPDNCKILIKAMMVETTKHDKVIGELG